MPLIEQRNVLTLLARDAKLIEALGLAACRLDADVEKDISEAGCAGWKSGTVCHDDHGLLALDDIGEGGDRTTALCRCVSAFVIPRRVGCRYSQSAVERPLADLQLEVESG